MVQVLFVANEVIWPPASGGRLRMAGLAGALSRHLAVTTAEPADELSGQAPATIVRTALPAPRQGKALTGFLSPLPRVGQHCLSAPARHQLRDLLRHTRPDVVMVSHSYLVPLLANALHQSNALVVTDFQNVERERYATSARHGRGLHGLSAAFEGLKARRWEPLVARRSDLVLAVSEEDAQALAAYGAREPLVVPNARFGPRPYVPSPANGPVLYFGNAAYGPNEAGGRWLLEAVWPLVTRLRPGATLAVAGHRTGEVFSGFDGHGGVRVLGSVDHEGEVLDGCALAVAPVTEGGGGQLKVTNALSAQRVVVTTPFSARSVPVGVRPLCPVAQGAPAFAQAIVDLLDHPERRHQSEAALKGAIPTWDQAVEPVVRALATLLEARQP